LALKKIQFPSRDYKVPFWQFFRDGRALFVWSSKIPRWISKILFVLDFYEFLAILEGKVRKGYFF
jgi:hypothetical protein